MALARALALRTPPDMAGLALEDSQYNPEGTEKARELLLLHKKLWLCEELPRVQPVYPPVWRRRNRKDRPARHPAAHQAQEGLRLGKRGGTGIAKDVKGLIIFLLDSTIK